MRLSEVLDRLDKVRGKNGRYTAWLSYTLDRTEQ